MTEGKYNVLKEDLLAELKHGSPHQRFMAALKFYQGEEVMRNLPLALQGFEKLAAEGDETATERVVIILLDGGIGIARDPVRAAVLLKNLSEKRDNSWAQYQLGCLYDQGEGVRYDPVKAFEWYQKAARPRIGGGPGHVHATFKLIGMHVATALGKRIQPDRYPHDTDMRKAAKYCRGLIKANDSSYQGRAFYEMGRFYENGYGVHRNIGRALMFYRKAERCPYPQSAKAAKMAVASLKRLDTAQTGLSGLWRNYFLPRPRVRREPNHP
jgi:TPR repeat protein